MQQKGDIKKKYWRVHSKNGESIEFFPVFEVNPETGEVEAKQVEIKVQPREGKEQTFTMNWLDLYMFVYFACNEELRQGLAARYERKLNYIPYDITVQLSPEEKVSGLAKRRIELPVDELNMAVARDEAFRLFMKDGIKDPRSYVYKKPRKII